MGSSEGVVKEVGSSDGVVKEVGSSEGGIKEADHQGVWARGWGHHEVRAGDLM